MSSNDSGSRRISHRPSKSTDEPHGIDVGVGPTPRSASDNSNYYDNDFDPLTTKVVRVYKKSKCWH